MGEVEYKKKVEKGKEMVVVIVERGGGKQGREAKEEKVNSKSISIDIRNYFPQKGVNWR